MSRIPIYISIIIVLTLIVVYVQSYPFINVNNVLLHLVYYPFHHVIPVTCIVLLTAYIVESIIKKRNV